MFFVDSSANAYAHGLLRPADTRVLAACVAGSIALHVALLTLLPEIRAPRETPAKPLIVDLKQTVEPPPPIVEPLKNEPEVKPVPRERPQQVQTPVPAEHAPQPVKEEQAPPPAPSFPPVISVPPAPAASAPAPVSVPTPEPRPVPTPAPPVAPRVRTDAAYLHNPSSYPTAARRRGDQGTVMVRVLVSAKGLPRNVSLEKSSGISALDDAAVSTVQSWRFVPAREGGQAVEALYIVPVVYKLN